MHGEHLVVGLGLHQIAGRRQQFQANHQGEDSAQKEEHRDRDQIQKGDALMVTRKQPGLCRETGVQVVLSWPAVGIAELLFRRFENRGTHLD